jgi:hypothetical protein
MNPILLKSESTFLSNINHMHFKKGLVNFFQLNQKYYKPPDKFCNFQVINQEFEQIAYDPYEDIRDKQVGSHTPSSGVLYRMPGFFIQ